MLGQAGEKLPQSPAASDAVSAIVSQRKRMKNRTLDQIAEVQRLAADTGMRSTLEALAENARVLPFAVGDHMTHRLAPRPDDQAVAPPSPQEAARLLMEEE